MNFTGQPEEILYFENFDLENMVSPVDPDTLERLLTESEYDTAETKFLVDGFRRGFSIGYDREEKVKQTAPNLPFRVGNEIILWNKVMKEVKAKRYAGPFKEIPFKDDFIQSPIGLVPKDNGKECRLIFHLSYPRNNRDSVNINTPSELCTVKYCDFDFAVQRCIEEGPYCKLGKSDMKNAFRNLGILKKHWRYLVMKAKSPIDGPIYYFVDKCLPFGVAISCAHFQKFSDAVAHLVQWKTTQAIGLRKPVVNYLDDYLFVAMLASLCDKQIQIFLDLCKEIGFPVAFEKTFWSTITLVFLGLLLDTVNQMVMLLREKVLQGRAIVVKILNKKSKKVTIKELQKLCGFLNFLGRAIVPGQAFTRRLYTYTKSSILKPHHHIRVNGEM